MPTIQKHFEFTQRIISFPVIDGKKKVTIHGEMFINGEGYYDGTEYDYDLNGVYFFPESKGSYTANNINVLGLLLHFGIDPKEDERIKYPILAHLEWLYLPEVTQAINAQAMAETKEGVRNHFRLYEPPEPFIAEDIMNAF